MTLNNQQIELITQGVLRELRSRGVVVAAGRSSVSPAQLKVAEVKSDQPNTSVGLSDKVITEHSLSAANAAGKTVSVPRGAIVTPSGHDYIRRNNVTLTSGTATTVTATSGVLIVAGGGASVVSAATTAEWQVIEAGCEFQAASKAKAELSKPIVCCVSEPSVTACLLNRNPNVRAAVITQETDLSLLGSVMNPHAVCLNPVGWSFAALLRLLRQMSVGGNAVPAKWQELAGAHA